MNFKVGILGKGTVGGSFAKLLAQRTDAIAELTGRRPEICGVLSRSEGDFAAINHDADVVVELIGGIEPARSYVEQALAAGRHVITANKQLISRHGQELFDLAESNGVQLRYEAAVAGVIPAIRTIGEGLAGTDFQRIHGIVNGTTNYILTEMQRNGLSYPEALEQAQQLGFAEADPTDDVSGADAVAKMAILARLAFGVSVDIDRIRYEGIADIASGDLEYAVKFGLSLKLIGTAERIDGGVSVRVHPVFLYGGHPLASVSGSFNAVTVEADAITEVTMSGPGAGGSQTASAVLADLVSVIAAKPAPILLNRDLPLVDDVTSAFYMSLEVVDRPGVLAQVTATLGNHGVSVKSFFQQGQGDNARLVMVTHPLLESRFFTALSELAELNCLRSAPRSIRVIEEEFVD